MPFHQKFPLALCLLLLIFFSCKWLGKNDPKPNVSTVKIKPTTQMPMPALPLQGDYADLWKIVDSLQNQGQYRSALEQTEAIQARAARDKNGQQIVKALLFRGKFMTMLEEDGLAKAIQTIEKEMLAAGQPEKSVLQSALGQLYATYLQNKGWELGQRTPTSDEGGDILTWSAAQVERHALDLYIASVSQEALLRGIPVEQFRDVITVGEGDSVGKNPLRPSLFDLLAHRAIQHFSNEHSYMNEPTYAFQLDQESAFAPAAEFAKATFETQDSSSGKWLALRLFQRILSTQRSATDERAVVADLLRLQFVHQNSTLQDKDAVYRAAMEKLFDLTGDHPLQGEIAYQLYSFRYAQEENKVDNARAAVAMAESINRKYPGTYGAKLCAQLSSEIRAPFLNARVEMVNLPNKPALVSLFYKNVKTVYVKVVQTNFDLIPWAKMGADKQYEYLNGLRPVHTRNWTLEDLQDYQQHTTEIAVDALPLGRYWLIASNNADFDAKQGMVAYSEYSVSNLALVDFNEQGNSQFAAVNRTTGEPLAGVKIEFFERDYRDGNGVHRLIHTAISDREGLVRPDLPNSYGLQTRASLAGDTVWQGQAQHHNHDRTPIKQNTQVHFFTDRSIYRPGQTVYFKGILFKNTLVEKKRNDNGLNLVLPQIVANQSVSVQLFDANGQPKAELKLRSNEFGTFNGTFTAPANGLTGQMRIQCTGGDGQAYFSVEEYKRPRFEVKMKPVEAAFRLNEKITVRGEAKNFAGNAVDGADINYRVSRSLRIPYWSWGGWWKRPNYNQEQREITNGTATSGADGSFAIEFEAIPDGTIPKKDQPIFEYQVTVDVTDITGETHSTQTTVSVGYVALQVELGLRAEMPLDSLHKVDVSASNMASQPQNVAGQITLQRLVQPKRTFLERYWERPDVTTISKSDFERMFPDFAWKNEDDPTTWAREDFTRTVKFNTADSKTVDLSQGLSAGYYLIILTTKDAFGEKVEIQQIVRVFGQNNQFLTPNVLPRKTLYEPGDKAILDFGGANPEGQHFFFGFEHLGNFEPQWKLVKSVATNELQISENDRGGIFLHWFAVRSNRVYNNSVKLEVPWSNKDLKITYETFRDKLSPGQKEEWRIKISGPKKEKVAAEMVAAMYDASLDQFRPHSWQKVMYPSSYNTVQIITEQVFGANTSTLQSEMFWEAAPTRQYKDLNWFDFPMWGGGRYRGNKVGMEMMKASAAGAVSIDGGDVNIRGAKADATNYYIDGVRVTGGQSPESDQQLQKPNSPPAPIRRNLNETVFFFPELHTDADGNVVLSFKMNEALTRWKLLLYAHTKNLEQALSEREIVTQKEMMVIANPPRFLREGDEIEFSAKISNLTKAQLEGTATISLLDAATLQPVEQQFGLATNNRVAHFSALAGQSAAVSWRIKVPDSYPGAVTWQIFSDAGSYRDGEESTIPVVPNRMLVTETMPISVRGNQTKTFVFENLKNQGESNSLLSHHYTLEFTSNPVWYAVQSLPYLMEFPHECSEQMFSRFYANTLASNVVEKMPQIKRVYDQWKGTGALKSNLSKNQELKYALLEETPWVLDAQNEEVQQQNIALLFDLNRMADERDRVLTTLAERQYPSGGWPWFPGGQDNWYITQHIVSGFAHLQKLGAFDPQKDQRSQQMIDQALGYCNAQIAKQYAELERLAQAGKIQMEDDHLDGMAIQYLYVRSFYPVDKPSKEVGYYLGQAQKYWLGKGLYQEGLLALALHRMGNKEAAAKIVTSLRERATMKEELGMYWPVDWGFYWYQLPVETQALMVEVFSEVANDPKSVEELRIWLLKNKQTNRWESTKATAEAVYALLLNGDNWLNNTKPVQISMGGKPLKISEVAIGSGYFKQDWAGSEVKKSWAEIKVENPNSNIVWGAAYWQYFEDLDKIKDFDKTPLKIVKQLFKEENSPAGPVLKPIADGQALKRGDKIKVRIEIRVDRAMEFVHLKDMRAAGLEPVNVLSGYRWQGGLGYYESTKDLATHFFIDYLPRGTFVFEYPLVVSLRGDMSNGITTMQCMYAPEFTSHSKGVRVRVD